MKKTDVLLAIERLKQAVARLEDALGRVRDDLDRDGAIQRFEFTVELLWKTLAIQLEYQGITCQSPRNCIKLAFRHGLQASLRSRERFWDIQVPKIDSIFDNSLVPRTSWSPGVPPQHRKLVAATHRPPI